MAMSRASTINSVRRWSAMDQPTIRRLNNLTPVEAEEVYYAHHTDLAEAR